MKQACRRFVAVILCLAYLLGLCPAPASALSFVPKTKVLSIDRAVSMAFANDAKYRKVKNQIILKYAQYNQALEKVKAKRKDFGTFRFSLLISLKFPEYPYMVEDFEMTTKGPDIMNEIIALQRQLLDIQLDVTNRSKTAYNAIYSLIEQITLTESMLAATKQTYNRNVTRLATGLALQSDVDKTQKTMDEQESTLARQKRELENAKTKLSDLIGLDINTGYRFNSSLDSLKLQYAMRQGIIDYTLATDVKINNQRDAVQSAKSDIQLLFRLFNDQYGGYMADVNRFVNQVLNGAEVDYDSFKQVYDQMLVDVEKKWQGAIRILFIKIPKEWFKGKLSGSRYIDDERQALYIACMEYGDQKKELDLMIKEKTAEINGQFENLITLYNNVESNKTGVARQKVLLDKVLQLNKVGLAEFGEVADEQAFYQSLQMDLLLSMVDYTDSLNAFDQLTYGYVTYLRTGAGFAGDGGAGGVSHAGLDDLSRPYYFIHINVPDVRFTFSLHFPEDYDGQVTHYELWQGDQQIDSRQPLAGQITHMPLVYGDSYILTLRLYAGDKFVDQMEIDTNILRDYLDIKEGAPPQEPDRKLIGQYTTAAQPLMNMVKLTFDLRPGEKIASFLLKDEQGKLIYYTEPAPVAEGITYLGFALRDLSVIKAEFYNEDQEKLYAAVFETENKEIWALLNETE